MTNRSTRTMSDNEKRFKNVAKQLRKQGVQFRINISECCRGCVTPEKLGLKHEKQAYGFIYGGQGQRIAWNENGEVVYADSQKPRGRNYFFNPKKNKVEKIYVNHGNGSADEIVSAFNNSGFDASWDGNEYSCVEIDFN